MHTKTHNTWFCEENLYAFPNLLEAHFPRNGEFIQVRARLRAIYLYQKTHVQKSELIPCGTRAT